ASTLVRRADGGLDLQVAASVAWLLEPPRHARLIATLGLDPVLAAIEAGDLAGFMLLCQRPPASLELQREHPELIVHCPLDLIAAARPGARPRLRAVALATWLGTWAATPNRAASLVGLLLEHELCECVSLLV